MNKFLVDGKNQFSFQKYIKPIKRFGYFPENRIATKEDLYKHFYSGGKETANEILGSIAFRPSVNGRLKYVVFDIDRQKQKEEFLEKVPPVLSRDGFKGILEHGGDKFERCKYWIPMDVTIETARHYIFQVGEELGLNFYDASNKETYFDEIFGVNKVDFVCRLPLGYHIRRKDTFPIEVDGELSKDPEVFIKEFLAAPQPNEEYVQSILKPLTFVKPKFEAKAIDTKRETFYYIPRNLKLPCNNIPDMLKPVYKNCQAANQVLNGIINEDYIEERGDQYHHAGLYTFGMAIYSDIMRSRSTKKYIVNGRNFAKYLEETYRSRSAESHAWETTREKAEANPNRLFASCKAWDEKFAACEGCPWRGQITSPKQFIYGQKIKKEDVGSVELVTLDQVRNEFFPKFTDRVFQIVNNGLKKALLLKTPQNTGKSYSSAKAVAELAKQGKKILVSVPNGDLAIEWKQWIEEEGEKAFILFSHKKLFEKKDVLGLKHGCPYFTEIQGMVELGVQSSTYKEAYCSGCPYLEKCYYPRQYQEAQDDQYKVVIIQHAHLQCQEVIYELLNKSFDVFFIDESFEKITYSAIKIFEWEKEILKEFDYKWSNRLYKWLTGEMFKPVGKLDPPERELKAVKAAFTREQREYRIPQFIRFYNQGKRANKYTGVEVIYELPDIPVLVTTNATPPEKLMQRLTGIEDWETWGDGMVLDITSIHPDNQVIQVLDTSVSRTFLETDDNLETILFRIGDLVEEKYKGKKVLITVSSKEMREKVSQFFLDNLEEFPTPKDIGLMSKGVNKWKDFDVQFLMAGRYAHGGEYMKDTYEYKSVYNHFLYREGKSTISNPYPVGMKNSVSLPVWRDEESGEQGVPVRRIEKTKDGKGVIREYKDFKVYPPAELWANLCFQYNAGETQQAIRLRFDDKKPRTVYILGNMNLPNVLVTKSIMLNNFLNG